MKARESIVIVDLQIVWKSLIGWFVLRNDGIFMREWSGQGQNHFVVTVGEILDDCIEKGENKYRGGT